MSFDRQMRIVRVYLGLYFALLLEIILKLHLVEMTN